MKEAIKTVEVFCDGACSGNPGPGGWGAILRFGGLEKEISGFEPMTTNNRMELTACISALDCLKEPCRIILQTDSQYLAKAFKDKWIDKWQKNGWRTANRQPVKNRELWEMLIVHSQKHQIEWVWIRGHSGHPENERCDQLAVIQRDNAVQISMTKPQKKTNAHGCY